MVTIRRIVVYKIFINKQLQHTTLTIRLASYMRAGTAGDAWIEKLAMFISRRRDLYRWSAVLKCLPTMSPSSSTFTGSVTYCHLKAIFNMNTSRVQLRSSTTVDGKDVRLTTGVSLWTMQAQRDILPHRHSLSDLTIRLHITTSLKSISQKTVTLSPKRSNSLWPV